MEDYPQQRDNSAGIGSVRRPAKRPRTDISRDDSPGTGPSSSTSTGNTFPGLANTLTNTVTVPGSILLPNRDSQGRRTVIDLTEDDSPPRRQPEIIDVDALPDRPSSYFYDGNPTPEDEDYRFLMARRRYPRPVGLAPPARPVEPSLNQHNNRPYMPRYHQEITSPILGHGARSVNELGSHRHMNSVGESGGRTNTNIFHHIIGGMFGSSGGFGFSIHGRGTFQVNDMGFHPPGQLDYRLGGIVETPPVEDPVRRREAEYKAPQPAKEGFTRSPTSNDCLVCPCCDHELGTHSDEEGQATVWLGKCGHVYCGKCAAMFRSLSVRAKKQRGVHSGQCEVDGCTTNLRGKGLWEIFL